MKENLTNYDTYSMKRIKTKRKTYLSKMNVMQFEVPLDCSTPGSLSGLG